MACSSRVHHNRWRSRGRERTLAAAKLQPTSGSEASSGKLPTELRRCFVLDEIRVDRQRHPPTRVPKQPPSRAPSTASRAKRSGTDGSAPSSGASSLTATSRSKLDVMSEKDFSGSRRVPAPAEAGSAAEAVPSSRQPNRGRRNARSDLDCPSGRSGSTSGARLTGRTALARGASHSTRARPSRRTRPATTSASVAARRLLRCLADTTHQIVRQFRSARLRLAHDVLCTPRERAVRRQSIETRPGRREEEPAGPHAPSADALAVDCVSYVLESLCEVDDAF